MELTKEILDLIGNGAGVVAIILTYLFIRFISDERELRHQEYEHYISALLEVFKKNNDKEE